MRLRRCVCIWVLLGLGVPRPVLSEGGDDARAGRSTQERIYGLATMLPTAKGLVAIGGKDLRRLPPGSRRWETLHTVPGDNLYRVIADDQGRLLAAWSREKFVHFISSDGSVRLALPKPEAPADVQNFEVSGLAFSADGLQALMFTSGNVRVNTRGYSGPSRTNGIYAVALDGQSPPTLLARIDHAFRLHASSSGGVFGIQNVAQKCDANECSIPSIVALDIQGGRVIRKTLADAGDTTWTRARVVRGSDDRQVTIVANAWLSEKAQLVRWRYGDAQAIVTAYRYPGDQTTPFVTRDGKLLEFRVRDGFMELWGDALIANLGELQEIDLGFHGLGTRANGTIWFHWGDHIGLYAPGQPPRSYSIKSLAPRRGEWAGADIYDQATDSLWIGIDEGAGRYFVRVSLQEADQRAKPWPAGKPVERTRGEYAGYDPKDASTADHLYNAAGLRPIKNGLVSMGGAALRRFTNGSKRWQTLHVIPKDNLYRVAADDRGRILAVWESDPNIHLFADGQHVTFPKPTMQGPVLGSAQVDSLAFLPNGREALVTMSGQVKSPPSRRVPEPVHFYYSHWGTEAYRLPLEGGGPPQLLYREPFAYAVYDSVRGSIFAMPKYDGQQCEALTCMPITEIVAYEITDAGVRKTTIIRGDAFGPNVYLASAVIVRGSDDERVAMVVRFTKNEGKYWPGGGRGILRWRWGQTKSHYQPLPGHDPLMPQWLLTRDDDFIELVEHYDKRPETLEVRRFLARGGEQSTKITALTKMATTRGLGERADGGLWLHWGEHLGLISPGQPPRSYDLGTLVPRGSEWAGAYRYVADPESLWVGLDGRGRRYVRVDLTDAEKRSKPWR